MKIFLNGFMASGKTTVGKKLANRLNFEFIDLDDYIETKHNHTIRFIFEQEGENSFRKKEQEALNEVLKKDNIVISTGGGAPCFFDNMDVMNKNGITIYLDLDVDTLADRLEKSKDFRPLIWGKSKESLKNYISETLEKRNSFYRQAKHSIFSKDIKVDDLMDVLKEYSKG